MPRPRPRQGGARRMAPWERLSHALTLRGAVGRVGALAARTRSHAALVAMLAVLASCQSMAALGRAVERAAYPTGGAALGAAVGGPGGAAAGGAAGHLLGESILHDGGAGRAAPPTAGEVVAEQVRMGFIDILLVEVLWVPFVVWIVLALVVALRLPWLPQLVWDWVTDRAERKRGPR